MTQTTKTLTQLRREVQAADRTARRSAAAVRWTLVVLMTACTVFLSLTVAEGYWWATVPALVGATWLAWGVMSDDDEE
jgi:hypothetical protein